jgi:PAS domain S-box-containing protein
MTASYADLRDEIAARIAALDRRSSPLGPPGQWTTALRNVLDLISAARAQIVLFWGPDYVALYNADYAPTIGDKHPRALGRPAVENWAELWSDLEPLLRNVRESGEAFYARDRPFYIERHGGLGEYAYFDISYSPVHDDDGSIGGVLCIVSETTLRLRAEQKAVTERDRLWSLSQDPFLVTDYEGRWLTISPAWTRILGWSEEELLGRTSEWMEHPDDRRATDAKLHELAQGGTTLRFENRFRTKAGDYRWFAWTAVPSESTLLCVARDITEQKLQADILAKAEAQLRQSQKMEAVGQLTGGLAHDFNNLLTGITGSFELLSARLAQGRYSDADRYIGIGLGAAKRAASLTHRLLAFSRQQTLAPVPTDINRLASSMEELIRRTVGPEVSVEIVATVGLWTTLVDPNQLENALLNLCLNARDAMASGGRLTIETANRWVDERASRERELPRGQYVSLCVSDTGTGMTPDIVEKAFDPFFTTKPLGQGTGLGLSMIYGFAKQSGGQARIYSEPDEGTVVCIYLPRFNGDALETETQPGFDGRVEPGARRGTVLIVDDEPSVRVLVTDVLEQLGCAVIEAADGASGLRILRSDVKIDLLISDIGLPGGLNGRQMMDAARDIRPDLKVLFITGYAENAVMRNGQMETGMQVMSKPFAIDDLAARIKTMLTEKPG